MDSVLGHVVLDEVILCETIGVLLVGVSAVLLVRIVGVVRLQARLLKLLLLDVCHSYKLVGVGVVLGRDGWKVSCAVMGKAKERKEGMASPAFPAI
jgi:hypothetical protein